MILLNCDQSGDRTERPRLSDIATRLCVRERKIDRLKKKFVQEGLDLALNHQPAQREYELKVDGRLEAQLRETRQPTAAAPGWPEHHDYEHER